MNIFTVKNECEKLRPGISVGEVMDIIRTSEKEAFTSVGGINNPKLRHHFIKTLEATISHKDPSVTLPEGAGEVIAGGLLVNDMLADVLTPDMASAVQNNPLRSRAAIRYGNKLTFQNISQKDYTSVRVTFSREITPAQWFDGLDGHIDTTKTYTTGGKELSILIIDRPTWMEFREGDLAGGSIRIVKSGAYAEEYSIYTNFYEVSDEARSGKIQKIVLNDDKQIVEVNFVNYASEEGGVNPVLITKFMTPVEIRPAVLSYCQYLLTGNTQYKNDFSRITEALR